MSDRLFLPPPLHPGRMRLDSDRSHYLCRVLRKRRGEHLRVMDGAGAEYDAELLSPDTRASEIQIHTLLRSVPSPAPRLHLVCGLLKPAAMDLVMQKATELGATDIWPLASDFTNARKGEPSANRLSHWRRILISAAEQCGQLHVPELHPLTHLDEQLRAPAGRPLVLDLDCPPLPADWPREETAVLIGPEGGWSEAERARFDARSWPRFGLGELTLRAETAQLAALAVLGHFWRTQPT